MNHLEEVKRLRSGEDRPVCNCAQTLLMAFADEVGISEEKAESLGSFLGTGLMHGATCGVLNSALMILGMKGYDNKTAQELIKKFRSEHDSTTCAQLLTISKNNGIARKEHCDGLIFEMAETLEKIIASESK